MRHEEATRESAEPRLSPDQPGRASGILLECGGAYAFRRVAEAGRGVFARSTARPDVRLPDVFVRADAILAPRQSDRKKVCW